MTFGNQLRSFSKTIDIVTDDIRSNILRTTKDKLQKSLGIEFVTLHIETVVNDLVGIRTSDWYIGGSPIDAVSLKNSQGSYTTQIALSYSTNKILWIVCENKGFLNDCDKYLDLYSKTNPTTIPKYLKHSETNSKTCNIIPLCRQILFAHFYGG